MDKKILDENFSHFKHIVRVDVRFGDIDLLRHVNNASYSSMLDEGRVKYFRDAGGLLFDWDNIPFVLANLNTDFIASAKLFDTVNVLTRVTRIGNKSFSMEQQIRLHPHGQLVCEAKMTLVGYDRFTESSHIVTDEWVAAFEQLEGVKLKG